MNGNGNRLVLPLVWAAAAVIVITALGLVVDSILFDHDLSQPTMWLADIVRNIVLVGLGFATAGAYEKHKAKNGGTS